MTGGRGPLEVYAAFASNIDTTAVGRIIQAVATAMTQGASRLHLLFQSEGGSVGDGVCLYNFFKSLPVPLTIYNVGSVASAATVAFLGAKTRKASAQATFMVHRTVLTSSQSPTAGQVHAIAESMAIDDRRTEAILRAHLRLTDAQWTQLDGRDLVFAAQEAVECGFADEIGEFSPPAGTKVFSI